MPWVSPFALWERFLRNKGRCCVRRVGCGVLLFLLLVFVFFSRFFLVFVVCSCFFLVFSFFFLVFSCFSCFFLFFLVFSCFFRVFFVFFLVFSCFFRVFFVFFSCFFRVFSCFFLFFLGFFLVFVGCFWFVELRNRRWFLLVCCAWCIKAKQILMIFMYVAFSCVLLFPEDRKSGPRLGRTPWVSHSSNRSPGKVGRKPKGV